MFCRNRCSSKIFSITFLEEISATEFNFKKSATLQIIKKKNVMRLRSKLLLRLVGSVLQISKKLQFLEEYFIEEKYLVRSFTK